MANDQPAELNRSLLDQMGSASGPAVRHDRLVDGALEVGGELQVTLSLDHGQLIVLDGGAGVDVDAYTAEAQTIGLAQFDGGIVVFTYTGSSVETPLRVRLRDRWPAIDACDHEYVVIAGLRCTTGEVRVLSPEETGGNERSLAVPAGAYGVLVCGDGFGHTERALR